MIFEAPVKVDCLQALKATRNAINVAAAHGIESNTGRYKLDEAAAYIEGFFAKIVGEQINIPQKFKPVKHDGGPDKVDGAPSDGTIQ